MINAEQSKKLTAKGNVEAKSLAIAFAKWVSNQQVLDDFWAMSNEVQEECYELFIKEINSKQ